MRRANDGGKLRQEGEVEALPQHELPQQEEKIQGMIVIF
jgi:hypothetical protein